MMWDKVSWLFFWVCMTLWFGNLFGCASTQRELFVEEPARQQSRQVELVRDVTPEGDQVFYLQEVDAANAAAPAEAVAAPETPKVETQPSLSPTSLDRSHWPKMTVGPITGKTTHLPVYFRDCPISEREGLKINFNDPQEQQLEAALAGHKDGGYDNHHCHQRVVQPLKFAVDIVAWPIYMCLEAPWRRVTTP